MSSILKPILNPWQAWGVLLGAILGGISGAFILGHILEQAARILLNLSQDSLLNLILSCLLMIVLCVLGTTILFFSFYISNKFIKITAIIFSVFVPSLIEIIDLTLRAIHILNDLPH